MCYESSWAKPIKEEIQCSFSPKFGATNFQNLLMVFVQSFLDCLFAVALRHPANIRAEGLLVQQDIGCAFVEERDRERGRKMGERECWLICEVKLSLNFKPPSTRRNSHRSRTQRNGFRRESKTVGIKSAAVLQRKKEGNEALESKRGLHLYENVRHRGHHGAFLILEVFL